MQDGEGALLEDQHRDRARNEQHGGMITEQAPRGAGADIH
jgi:hypothetical protein